LNDDLSCAINNAMQINREDCIKSAQAYNWKNVAEQFLNNLSCTKSHKLSEFDKTSSVS